MNRLTVLPVYLAPDHRTAAGPNLAGDTYPELVTSRLAGRLCGVSQTTFNDWVRQGAVPDECKHKSGYGGWQRYSTRQLIRWLRGELTTSAPGAA